MMLLHRQRVQQEMFVQLYNTTSIALTVHRQVLLATGFASNFCLHMQFLLIKLMAVILSMLLT